MMGTVGKAPARKDIAKKCLLPTGKHGDFYLAVVYGVALTVEGQHVKGLESRDADYR